MYRQNTYPVPFHCTGWTGNVPITVWVLIIPMKPGTVNTVYTVYTIYTVYIWLYIYICIYYKANTLWKNKQEYHNGYFYKVRAPSDVCWCSFTPWTSALHSPTWWLITVSKWVIIPSISELTLLSPFVTRDITYLVYGSSAELLHQVKRALTLLSWTGASPCKMINPSSINDIPIYLLVKDL